MSDIFICTVETAALETFKANNTGHGIPANVVALTFAADSKTNEVMFVTGDAGDDKTIDVDDCIDTKAMQTLADNAKANCTTHSAPGWISSNVYYG